MVLQTQATHHSHPGRGFPGRVADGAGSPRQVWEELGEGLQEHTPVHLLHINGETKQVAQAVCEMIPALLTAVWGVQRSCYSPLIPEEKSCVYTLVSASRNPSSALLCLLPAGSWSQLAVTPHGGLGTMCSRGRASVAQLSFPGVA